MYEGITICHDQDLLLQFRNIALAGPASFVFLISYRGKDGQILTQYLRTNVNTDNPDFYEINLNPCQYLNGGESELAEIEYLINIEGSMYSYNFEATCCKEDRVQLLFLTKSKFYKTLMFCFSDDVSTTFFNESIELCECCSEEPGEQPLRSTRSDLVQTLELKFLSKEHYSDLLLCELGSSEDIYITKNGVLYPVTFTGTTLEGSVDMAKSNFDPLQSQTFSVSLRLNKKI